MNKVCFCIENCCDCPNSYTQRIWTADSFEHEEGIYCSKIEDMSRDGFGKNGKHKMITFDDWDIRKYATIPDWCPLKA